MDLYPEFADKSILDAVRRRSRRSPLLAERLSALGRSSDDSDSTWETAPEMFEAKASPAPVSPPETEEGSLGDQVLAEIDDEPPEPDEPTDAEEPVYGDADAEEDIGALVDFDALPKSEPKRVLGKTQKAGKPAAQSAQNRPSDSQSPPTGATGDPEKKASRPKQKVSLLDQYFKGL